MDTLIDAAPLRLGLEHHYAALPARFFAEVAPVPVREPALLQFNAPLAAQMGLSALEGVDEQRLAALFSGNALPADARPIALAYAGHQFAHFVPQLGDGRALLLGEKRAPDGRLHDIQLKGSGITPFSRAGDGRAVVGPMLREYLVSEAMHALGIPTTRSLAVVATGERVFREEVLPGAILTRVAASHVRVGTFEYFAARGDVEALRALLDFAVARHDPDLAELPGHERAAAFLDRVVHRQASLLAQWMSVGFIHGVMNTDNMAVSGETIDYGPCAFMDHYDPKTVFSSIDHRGRYAYDNQPAIAQWNLARLAETLLPLMAADPQAAIEPATARVQAFMADFDAAFRRLMCAKLGLVPAQDADTEAAQRDADLVTALFAAMRSARADYTNTLRALADAVPGTGDGAAFRAQFGEDAPPSEWLERWHARLATEGRAAAVVHAAMLALNPAFIPRNHRVEAALAAATTGDLAPFERLLAVLRRPFDDQPEAADLAQPPGADERVLATFCGT